MNDVSQIVERVTNASDSELLGVLTEQFSSIRQMSECEVIPFFRSVLMIRDLVGDIKVRKVAQQLASAAFERMKDIRRGWDYEDIRFGLGGEIDTLIAQYSA
jgi:uncharacterized membrane-anchored protein